MTGIVSQTPTAASILLTYTEPSPAQQDLSYTVPMYKLPTSAWLPALSSPSEVAASTPAGGGNQSISFNISKTSTTPSVSLKVVAYDLAGNFTESAETILSFDVTGPGAPIIT